jgi:hypothetical protein
MERSPGCLVLARKCQKNLAYLGLQYIDNPSRRSLLLIWTDSILDFVSGLLKIEQQAKKCIELPVECVE